MENRDQIEQHLWQLNRALENLLTYSTTDLDFTRVTIENQYPYLLASIEQLRTVVFRDAE